MVSWLEGDGAMTRVLARQVTSAGAPGSVIKVAEGGQQSLGYPKIRNAGGETWIAWGGAKVQTAQLKK
jgi:hypothetical protein